MALATSTVSLRAFSSAPRLPARASKAQRAVVRAAVDQKAVQAAAVKAATFGSLAGSFLAAGNAQAAMEVANIAASDNRGLIIASLAAPMLGWVGFNILGPLNNQLAAMEENKARSVAAGLGLGLAALLAAGSADAATEAMQLADSDGRLGVIATLFVPVLGWVGYNIAQPFFNQLAAMEENKARSVAAGLGLGLAALLAAGNADAATEVMQLGASDGRLGVIATLFVPVLGWVAFNIAQPFFNQLAAMEDKKKSVAGAIGLGAAALLAAGNADAATEAMQLAGSDGRLGVIATLFVPVLGWVGFNIAQPFFNQLAAMEEKKKSVAGAIGLGAAALLAAGSADAATEAMQLADSDGRLGVIATLFVPVLGWVAFNIAQPFFNQLAAMEEKKDK